MSLILQFELSIVITEVEISNKFIHSIFCHCHILMNHIVDRHVMLAFHAYHIAATANQQRLKNIFHYLRFLWFQVRYQERGVTGVLSDTNDDRI